MEEIGVSGFILKVIGRCMEGISVPPRRFYVGVGLEGEHDADGIVPLSRVTRSLSALSEELGDESLGLRLAAEIERQGFGAFARAVWTGGNLGDALTRSMHFYPVASTELAMVNERRGRLARLSLAVRSGPAARGKRGWVFSDMLLGWHFVRARAATNRRFRLEAAHFRHEAEAPEKYAAFFDAPVKFGRPLDEIVYEAALLALPVRAPSSETELMPAGPRQVAAAVDGEAFVERVRAAASRALCGSCTVTSFSRDLGMTARAFQEELKAHGTTHRDLVDDVRRRLALDLVARQDVPLSAVARQLGFARLPAFYRAFARWTATTPGEFRARALRGQAGS